MTKTEFLQQLYNNLLPLSNDERNEIILDFEEHFSIGLESGKTEEQICAELGSPESCAVSYLQGVGNNTQQTAGNNNYGVYRPSVNTGAPVRNVHNEVYDRRNRFLWALMFFFFVLCAFGVYPTAIGLMISPIVIAVAAILMVAIVPTGLMIGFLVALSTALFTAGLLLFTAMTYLLKLSFSKSGF